MDVERSRFFRVRKNWLVGQSLKLLSSSVLALWVLDSNSSILRLSSILPHVITRAVLSLLDTSSLISQPFNLCWGIFVSSLRSSYLCWFLLSTLDICWLNGTSVKCTGWKLSRRYDPAGKGNSQCVKEVILFPPYPAYIRLFVFNSNSNLDNRCITSHLFLLDTSSLVYSCCNLVNPSEISRYERSNQPLRFTSVSLLLLSVWWLSSWKL